MTNLTFDRVSSNIADIILSKVRVKTTHNISFNLGNILDENMKTPLYNECYMIFDNLVRQLRDS